VSWFLDHVQEVLGLLVTHTWLAVVPLVVGLLLALPLGWLAHRYGWARPGIITATGLLYTIPSLALFILMPLFLGTGILDPLNVVAALTLYTVALLTRTVADGLAAVPDHVVQAAVAMGIGPWRRFLPVVSAGLRVAAVSNVSIVSVAALLGIAQLGSLFTDGFARQFLDPIVVGVIACLVLSLVLDGVILGLAWLVTPWLRQGRPARRQEVEAS
jgi:osmoprotectant transport system permease protein